ncbi:unnamed protein product [Ectocarpus sp. CCAP 1310/34]|nr:unnamed protein product [Ectocarpus sp. CCAP 1310/34]
MARLQRGKIRHERHGQIMQMNTAVLLCAVAGEEELFLVLAILWQCGNSNAFPTPTTLPTRTTPPGELC